MIEDNMRLVAYWQGSEDWIQLRHDGKKYWIFSTSYEIEGECKTDEDAINDCLKIIKESNLDDILLRLK